MPFRTETGIVVPAVTAEQMREVDRLAVEEFDLSILQMMENAGRTLAEHVRDVLGEAGGEVTILAGSGGNGGGGLCCARHLHNRGVTVWVVLERDAGTLTGAAKSQMSTLAAAGLQPIDPAIDSASAREALRQSKVVVDALIGYGLRGIPEGQTARLIDLCNQEAARVLALDVPSGLDATTGEAPGPVVRAERTLTLALPKTGLHAIRGELFLADIGIPPELFLRLGLAYEPPFGDAYWVRLMG